MLIFIFLLLVHDFAEVIFKNVVILVLDIWKQNAKPSERQYFGGILEIWAAKSVNEL